MTQRRNSRIASVLLSFSVSLYLSLVCLLLAHRTIPLPLYIALSAGFYLLLRLGSVSLPDPFRSREFVSPAPRFCLPVFLLCLGMLALYFAAYYPGGLSSDTWYQWRQARGTVALTDWHPVLHTLFLRLLYRISPNPAFAVGIQLLLYALAVEYAVRSLLRTGIPRILTALYSAYLILSPALMNLILFLWKDCAFTISALFLMGQLLNAQFSDGEWLVRWRNRIALAVTLCLVSILRHNGPALSLPILVWLFVSFPGDFRRIMSVSLLSVILFFGVKGPMYRICGVHYENQGIGETIGFPMSILSHVYAENPDCLDADIVEFLEDVAPLSTYREYDSVGDWNDIKWHVGTVYTNRPYSLLEIYCFAARAFLSAPALSMEALSYLWQMPMWPVGDAYWQITPYQVKSFHMSNLGVPFLKRVLNWLCRMSSEPVFAWMFWHPGFWMLLLCILSALYAPRRKRRTLLLASGLIPYHLATSFFLSSSTDFRFYLAFQATAPLALLTLLYDRKENRPS